MARTPGAAVAKEPAKTGMAKVLDVVERVGNKVPHPVVIFVLLIVLVIALSAIFAGMGTSVTFEAINPETHALDTQTVAARSLLSVDGIRFMYSGVIPHFMGFSAVGVIIVAMLGVGVAEIRGPGHRADSQARADCAAQGADLHPGLCRHRVEYRRRCRLPGPHTARRRGLPQRGPASAGGACGHVFRGGRRLQRQHLPQAARWHARRRDQRRHPDPQSEPLDLADLEPLVRHRLGPGDDGGGRGRQRPDHRASARQVHGRGRGRGEGNHVGGGGEGAQVRALGPPRHAGPLCADLRCRLAPRCAIRRRATSSATPRS